MRSENLNWLKSFQIEHKRNLKILHIGNIANNAYNNAKILSEISIDSDVICYDYYHIMGTPEWEDADFDINLIQNFDHFYPNWAKVNLGGFKRPKWFVQGPQNLCLDYLLAKNSNNTDLEKKLWEGLNFFNRHKNPHPKFSKLVYSYLFKLKDNIIFFYFKNFKKINKVIDNHYRVLLADNNKKILRLLYPLFKLIFYVVAVFFKVCFEIIRSIKIFFYKFKNRFKKDYFHKTEDKDEDEFYDSLFQCYKEKFPHNKERLTREDFSYLDHVLLQKWKKVMSFYDVVIGYSTDGIYPMMTGIPYIAFEHGTIREIPYQSDAQGRLCAVTYAKANHVMVTNFDCKNSADFLAPNKYTLINHPFDENHGSKVYGSKELRKKLLADLKSDFIFFFPTRHDWVEGDGYADKANDVFINSFGKLRGMGYRVGMVCCAWGKNVEASKKLLDSFNVSEYVIWSEPMATVQFERMALACDCVVDQFKLGSFGGILFKAMAVGAPILTFLDAEKLKNQFQDMPPVINCKNQIEIIDSVILLYEKPTLLANLRNKSLHWIKHNHSKSEILEAQLKQFKLLIQD